ncbi:MAG TPA: hypothetical protein VF653_09745, partial [Methylomirabilota bacterium]
TISASRTLLEILVDVALLVHRSPPDAAQRIVAWEDSAKLVAAEQCVSYLDRMGRRESPLYRTMTTWIEARGAAIREERFLYWPPQGKHPSRWTGTTLLDDCREVDELV